MSDNIGLGLLVAAAVFATPWVIYLSVKLGTYAFFVGRELFQKQREKDEQERRVKRKT